MFFPDTFWTHTIFDYLYLRKHFSARLFCCLKPWFYSFSPYNFLTSPCIWTILYCKNSPASSTTLICNSSPHSSPHPFTSSPSSRCQSPAIPSKEYTSYCDDPVCLSTGKNKTTNSLTALLDCTTKMPVIDRADTCPVIQSCLYFFLI